jgi:hypothetical protein
MDNLARTSPFLPEPLIWWTRYVKEQIRKCLVCKGATRRQAREKLENFYYAAIYDAVRDTAHAPTTHIASNAMKAKIVRIHNGKSTQLLLGVDDQDKHIDEPLILYQVLKQRKRQTSRFILNFRDTDGTTHTSPRAILRTFVDRIKGKYDDIQVDPGNVHSMLRGIRRTISVEANAALGTPINIVELHAAAKQGKKLKAPGYDGICHEFFQETWHFTKDDLLNVINQMYMGDLILPSQAYRVMVYVWKIKRPTTPDDYRPLTLLNTDLKLLSRIIANRLRPWLDNTLHPSQHCGVAETTYWMQSPPYGRLWWKLNGPIRQLAF